GLKTISMDKHVHRPTPMKPGFIRYTTLLSDNEIQDDDFYFTNSSIPNFIPSTQEHNAKVVYPPTGNIFSDGINYPEHSTMDVDDSQLPQGDMASKQADILKHQSTVLSTQKGRTRWSTTDTLVLIEAKQMKETLSSMVVQGVKPYHLQKNGKLCKIIVPVMVLFAQSTNVVIDGNISNLIIKGLETMKKTFHLDIIVTGL
ncbi:hypothetical protein KI387_042061, partial [Taxus chinensis]